MFQHVKRSSKSAGKHLLRFGRFMERKKKRKKGSRIAWPQVRRMHKCVGNEGKFVQPLSVFGHCYGAGVHFLNSSKHRKLIEVR